MKKVGLHGYKNGKLMNTPYEHGFMLSLLVLAIGGLLWLFTPFIPALFLALLIAIANLQTIQ